MSEERGVSGLITAGVPAANPTTVKMTQTHPCRAELTGTLSLGDGGKALEASYAGSGCEGVPLKATFTGVRVGFGS